MAPIEPVNPAEAFQAAGRSDISPLDIQGATPAIETVTVVDAPRISNALRKPPIPPPLPPSRIYTAAETCASCGRLPELHEDRGGPIGHAYQVQPVIP